MRKVHVLFAAAALGLVTMAAESDASACGGCFTPPETPTVVTDHRMILSIAKQQSTLYDQISYSGDPSSFAWVLPISGSVTVGLSADIVFQSLDQLTQTAVLPPPRNCPAAPVCPSDDRGGSLSAASPNESADAGVAVTKREVVGPYDTVQLHATDPTALQTWLAQNGFSLPDDVKPVVTSYVDEHFDFLALKLLPGKGVNDMRPVRVTSTGASSVLPLRMVAAGTGAVVGISLWVVGEGRYEPQNFPTFSVLPGDLAWDWTQNKSNYLEIRAQKTTENNGRAWEVESSLTLYPRNARRADPARRSALRSEQRQRQLLRGPSETGLRAHHGRERHRHEDGRASPRRRPHDLVRGRHDDGSDHAHALRPRACRAGQGSDHRGVGLPRRALEHPPGHEGAESAALPGLYGLSADRDRAARSGRGCFERRFSGDVLVQHGASSDRIEVARRGRRAPRDGRGPRAPSSSLMRVWLLALTLLGGCASNPSGGACEDYTPPASFDPMTPKVQFARDVMPVFKGSCGFSTCHGVENNPNGVYLGTATAKVYGNLVSQKSPENPSMNFVTPADTANSYLMHKMDGSQCKLDAQCKDASCQDSMPKNDVLLDPMTRDVVRRWISQGAQND